MPLTVLLFLKLLAMAVRATPCLRAVRRHSEAPR